ncbi:hypothetical protein [Flavobacterium anhuiense]|uniref:hypothetical protein n=1 Tax=Flavobacterium anhuiense TaxID=459526 RepID=UPI002026651C|nr:hypothetical protein [Flavobacterium anhuiense]URM36165.1 hypothetical protein LLY39_17315 [Flavobacterium anhuiense]
MKKTILILSLALISAVTFSQNITKVWESDSLFLKPESALYDSEKNIVYISNINGEYLAKDGNGFIYKLKTNGEIEVLKWVDGLYNPQGMGLYRQKLYVADINRVVRIDTRTAKIDKVYHADNAVFLNDITVDANSASYKKKTVCSISKFNDEIKPKRFQSFQIEDDIMRQGVKILT